MTGQINSTIFQKADRNMLACSIFAYCLQKRRKFQWNLRFSRQGLPAGNFLEVGVIYIVRLYVFPVSESRIRVIIRFEISTQEK